MKLMHLGDLHIGRSLGDFDLRYDQEYILNQLLELVQERDINAVLIAGDVYDKRIPSEAAVALLDDFIRELAEKHTKVFMISGNHDSDDRLNFGSSLFEKSEIYIASKFVGELRKCVLEDEEGVLNIYLLPFVKASVVKHFYPDCDIESYEDAVKTVIAHSEFDPNERNILVAHQFVAGHELPHMAGSESAGVQNVGLVEMIGSACMEQFDYVALGHIHSPQSVGVEHIRYAGSPLKYSLSEVHNEKSVPIITVGKKGDVDIELVPLKPKRDLRHIKGKMEELLDSKHMDPSEDFMYVTLTDEDIVNDAMSIFQQYYPNTIRIDYDNSHTKEMEHVDITAIAENKTFDELISDFYSQMYGCEISEEEMEIMKSVAREAGVIDEAD